MFPWKNPPAKSPFLAFMEYPTVSAPFTPGASGSPMNVSTKTKLSQEIMVARIKPIIRSIICYLLQFVEDLGKHNRISTLQIKRKLNLLKLQLPIRHKSKKYLMNKK